MRKILLLVISMCLVSVIVAAQHSNPNERPVKADLSVPTDVMLGATLLPAGEYRVICDRDIVTFARRDSGKVVHKVECKGRELIEDSKVTSLYTSTTPSGTKKVDKLLLKGSHVEHVF